MTIMVKGWRTWALGIAASRLLPHYRRTAILRKIGMRVGRRSVIEHGITISSGTVTIGENCYIGADILFDAPGGIQIGDNVSIGSRTVILTRDHPIMAGPVRHVRVAENDLDRPVHIGAGSWIGANVTILPGVTIAPASVIAAGSVVTQDVEPDALYAGVPAQFKKPLPRSS